MGGGGEKKKKCSWKVSFHLYWAPPERAQCILEELLRKLKNSSTGRAECGWRITQWPLGAQNPKPKKKKREASEKCVWLLQVIPSFDSFLPIQPIPAPRQPPPSPPPAALPPAAAGATGAWRVLARVPGQLLVKPACHRVKQVQMNPTPLQPSLAPVLCLGKGNFFFKQRGKIACKD